MPTEYPHDPDFPFVAVNALGFAVARFAHKSHVGAYLPNCHVIDTTPKPRIMTIDLDALEALYRDDKKRPVGTIGQADVLTLISELRQERERADGAVREMHARELHHFEEEQRSAGLEAALSRAEETIEKAKARMDDDLHGLAYDILAEYDKQKSTPVDQESGPDTLYTF